MQRDKLLSRSDAKELLDGVVDECRAATVEELLSEPTHDDVLNKLAEARAYDRIKGRLFAKFNQLFLEVGETENGKSKSAA